MVNQLAKSGTYGPLARFAFRSPVEEEAVALSPNPSFASVANGTAETIQMLLPR